MPGTGGNTSSTKHGLKNIKGGGQSPYDVKNLNHGETLASPGNLKIDASGAEDYEPDVNFGLPLSGKIEENTEDTQGNAGWQAASPGPGVTRPREVPGSKDPTPGGGW